jgi:3-hydroxy-3-methylglutaryl CoA synthase
MIGISSYGAYIPAFRLSRDLMAKAWGRGSIGGERSVANNDEDSATMAVEAAFDCLQGKAEKPERQIKNPRRGLSHTFGGPPQLSAVAIFGNEKG